MGVYAYSLFWFIRQPESTRKFSSQEKWYLKREIWWINFILSVMVNWYEFLILSLWIRITVSFVLTITFWHIYYIVIKRPLVFRNIAFTQKLLGINFEIGIPRKFILIISYGNRYSISTLCCIHMHRWKQTDNAHTQAHTLIYIYSFLINLDLCLLYLLIYPFFFTSYKGADVFESFTNVKDEVPLSINKFEKKFRKSSNFIIPLLI